MANIKINADTSPIKKSLMELSSSIKDLSGNNKISLFSTEERRFLKSELNQGISLMKDKITQNKQEVQKLVSEMKKLPKGSERELELRNKINDAYKDQIRLVKDQQRLQEARQSISPMRGPAPGRGGTGGGGMMGSLMGLLRNPLAIVVGLLTLGTGMLSRGTKNYRAGINDRIRLQGLGITEGEMDAASGEDLARAGMTRNEYIRRRMERTSRLGRGAASERDILQSARFERAMGLESGAMDNLAGGLRAQFGGGGANEAQMKIQASILASGMEDALAPYLESMTSLLANINENGITQTDELINVMASMAQAGARTPEQLAKAFQGIDQAMRGSSGEQNAFFQLAMKRAGIGGGLIGSTQLAVAGEGLFGANEDEIRKRGASEAQIEQLRREGAFKGVRERGRGILDTLLTRSGAKAGTELGDVTGVQFNVMQQLANEMFRTKGRQGWQVAQVVEQAQTGAITEEDARKKLEEIRTQDPQSEALNKINTSVSGTTQTLDKLNDTLKTDLGKNLVNMENAITKLSNSVLELSKSVTNASNMEETGGELVGGAGGAVTGGAAGFMVGGPLGAVIGAILVGIAGAFGGSYLNKDGNLTADKGAKSMIDDLADSIDDLADSISDGMIITWEKMTSRQKAPVVKNINNIKTNVRVQSSDGSVKDSTY